MNVACVRIVCVTWVHERARECGMRAHHERALGGYATRRLQLQILRTCFICLTILSLYSQLVIQYMTVLACSLYSLATAVSAVAYSLLLLY